MERAVKVISMNSSFKTKGVVQETTLATERTLFHFETVVISRGMNWAFPSLADAV